MKIFHGHVDIALKAMLTAQTKFDDAESKVASGWRKRNPVGEEDDLIRFLSTERSLQQLREVLARKEKIYNDLLKNNPSDALQLMFPNPTEKQKKALKVLMDAKSSVSFSHVTLDDCKRDDGLGLDLRYIERGMLSRATIHLPDEAKQIQIQPSVSLCEYLSKLDLFWAFNSEMSCRTR